jgi:UDP-glucose 4-epimerase
MKVLVTGGAGYIGSITAHELRRQGFEVVIFDSLEHGFKSTVADFDLVVGETHNSRLLTKVLKEKKIDAVIHFAAYIEMGESMENPHKYFHNNVFGSLQLFKAMTEVGVKKLVFSSTAGVYGNPERIPIKEEDRKMPENPYGESKLMTETILKWFDRIHQLRSISIRYFNAAGASLDGQLGEAHQPESHLIPNLIKVALGQKKEFTLFGNDYPTKDGTCIRDYIHVLDLAAAHILALQALDQGHQTAVYNAGTGQGYSNQQVIDMVKQVSAKDFPVKIGPRRPGDANELVADSTKLRRELGWQSQYSDLKTIVATAWRWHSSHPRGYSS